MIIAVRNLDFGPTIVLAKIVINSFYAWISYKYSVFVQHRFHEKGHTQNEGDRVHSTIEGAKRGKLVSGKPYQTIEMVTDDFDNFEEFVKINFSIKPKMCVSEIREIRFNKDNPFAMLFENDFHEKDYQKCNLCE